MIFKEVQYFRQWWILFIVCTSTLIPLVFVVRQLIHEKTFAFGAPPVVVIVIVAFILLSVLGLLIFLHLETTITSQEISYHFSPLPVKTRHILWEEVDHVYIRKYRPIGEYGGWGIRGLSDKNRAFNVSGEMGIQLVLKNGNRILLGTQKPREVEQFLKEIGKFNPPVEETKK